MMTNATMSASSLSDPQFLLDKDTKVGLLDYVVVLFLIFFFFEESPHFARNLHTKPGNTYPHNSYWVRKLIGLSY